MKTITDTTAITEALAKFQPGRDGAYPTCSCLSGQWEQENCQEWAERGTLNGAPAKVYYVFENAECDSGDAGDYPWDDEHVTTIEVAEKDEDGEYDDL